MFDITEINVRAGTGGAGAITFRHEKFVPFGGPDGGDGGKGGDVVVQADSSVINLWGFKKNARYRAEDGKDGKGQKKHGKNGANLILKVPEGTAVYTKGGDGQEILLGDLEKDGSSLVVAEGGRGGMGNVHFTTSTNQTPRLGQVGEEGEEKLITLELRLIADVGIIGYPNVGKSSLLAVATAAKPEVANYSFTTREPIVGVVSIDFNNFVMAEIPGLIEGAHLGRGLGHDFLRHSLRTRVFIHLVDGSTDSPLDNMIKVNNELSLYDSKLAGKPQVVVVNKLDIPDVRERREEIKASFKEAGIDVHFVSAATGEGVDEIMNAIFDVLLAKTEPPAEASVKVFHPRPKRKEVFVKREGNVFIIDDHELGRIARRVDMTDPTVRGQMRRQLVRLHIDQALERAGIKSGDIIRCASVEWEW